MWAAGYQDLARWLAIAGVALVLLGLVLRLSARNGHKVEVRDSPIQSRRDGDGDQYQAGGDIQFGDRATYYGAPGDTKPLLQLKERGEILRGDRGLIAWFPQVRVVNRDPHRHISAMLSLRTYDGYGDQVSSWPHDLSSQGEFSGAPMLPVVIDLGGGASIEAGATFRLGREPRPVHLWLVLVDRVSGAELVREGALFDERE
jgi:hypothetical protein